MESSLVTGASQINSGSGATGRQAAATKTTGKEDFMKLLLAQLKHQDPLKPLEGTDFAVQLAQFSSLEQLNVMSGELKTQSMNQMMLGYAQSANMIGKEVVTNSGNRVSADGGTTTLSYSLAKDAADVAITVLDGSGRQVAGWEERGKKAGLNSATWNSAGVAKGEYTFLVTASDGTGNPVAAETLGTGIVTAVHYKNSQILVTVNGRELPLGNVVSVREAREG